MKQYNPFRNLTRFEWILWSSSILVVVLCFLLGDAMGWLAFVASLIGVTALIFTARGEVVGQILIEKTNLTSARILVIFVTAGVILGALGIYKPLVDFAGAGATVPLTGFGYSLAKGAAQGVAEKGLIGAFTGGITATAGGIAAAIVFGYLNAVLFDPHGK